MRTVSLIQLGNLNKIVNKRSLLQSPERTCRLTVMMRDEAATTANDW